VKVPQKIDPDQWIGREGAWVNNTHPFAFEINLRIGEMRNKIHEFSKRFYMQNKNVTFLDIDEEIYVKEIAPY